MPTPPGAGHPAVSPALTNSNSSPVPPVTYMSVSAGSGWMPPPLVPHAPAPETLRENGLDPQRDTLYGLYEGTPLNERGFDDTFVLPDRITIYRRPLVRDFRTPVAIRREIRKTIVHELGHAFGLDDGA